MNPFSRNVEFHEGIDIAKYFGAPIRAPGPGTILRAEVDPDHGNLVVLSMSGGYVLRFGRLNEIRVKKGDIVKAGDLLGTMGATGRSTGPHLHLEAFWNGKSYDPELVPGLMLGFQPPN